MRPVGGGGGHSNYDILHILIYSLIRSVYLYYEAGGCHSSNNIYVFVRYKIPVFVL